MRSPLHALLLALLAAIVLASASAGPLYVKILRNLRVSFQAADGKVKGKRVIRAGTVVTVLERRGNQLRVRDRASSFIVPVNATNLQQALAAQKAGMEGSAEGEDRSQRERAGSDKGRPQNGAIFYKEAKERYWDMDTSLLKKRYAKSVIGKTIYFSTTVMDVSERNGKYLVDPMELMGSFPVPEATAEKLRTGAPLIAVGTVTSFMQYKAYDVPHVISHRVIRGHWETSLTNVSLYLGDKKKRLVPLSRAGHATILD